MAMTKKERLYGQLVVDFANAKTTDEAVHEFFENLRRVFDFSPTFPEEAKTKFPSAAFEEEENKTLAILPTLRPIFDLLGLAYEICDYNPGNETLTIIDLSHKKNTDGLTYKLKRSKPYNISSREFESKIGKKMTPEIYKSIKALLELKNRLEETKKNTKHSILLSLLNRLVYDFPLRRHFELEPINEMARNYEAIIRLHKNFYRLQKDIKELIEKTLRDDLRIEDETNPDEPLNIFLSIYNSEKMTRVIFDEKGSLTEVPSFNEQDFLDMEDSIDYYGFSATYDHFERLLGYCFIGFIKSDENKAHLGKCYACQKYFIATRLNNQRFCSRQCQQKAYHSRPEVRSKKAATRREKFGWQPRVNAN